MALTKAELVTPGSGYGAFRKKYERTGHLKFMRRTPESMEKWEHFFTDRRASLSGPRDRTGCILEWRRISGLSEKTTLKPLAPNYENWYAYYHLGILEFRKGNDKIAKRNV